MWQPVTQSVLHICTNPHTPFLTWVQVGADKRFDPSIYSHNILLNRQQQADSLQRSYVGGGDILAFTPAGAAGGLPPAHAAK